MRYAIRFSGYNQRRYSQPWIAEISAWPVGGKPELVWGGYVGDDRGGEAEIDSTPGTIIRWGQKDHRGNKGYNNWGIAQEDGSILECTQTEARKHYQGAKS